MTERSIKTLKVLRIVVWAIPAVILFGLVQRQLGLFGTTTLRCDANGCDSRVTGFASREPDRVTGIDRVSNEKYRLLSRDPINIDLELYRSFTSANVSLTYQSDSGKEQLQLGLRGADGKVTLVDLADRHPNMAYLASNWDQYSDGPLTLYQNPTLTTRQYSSVQGFLNQLPDRSLIRSYRADLTPWTRVAGYRQDARRFSIDTSLRGSHTFLVYAGQDEELDVRFNLKDLNRYNGADNAAISIWFGEKELDRVAVPDDGVTGTGAAGDERSYRLQFPAAAEGVYRIVFEVPIDDVFIRSIESSQHLITTAGQLYLAGNDEYRSLGRVADGPTTVWFKGERLSAATTHEDAIQMIDVGGRSLNLARVNQTFSIDSPNPDAFVPVTFPVQDVKLSSTDGQFALSSDSAFSVGDFELADDLQPNDLERVGYILARHRPPAVVDNWLQAEQTVTGLPAGRALHFSIVAKPSLSESRQTLKVKELRITLTGPLRWENIKEFFRTIGRKITTGT